MTYAKPSISETFFVPFTVISIAFAFLFIFVVDVNGKQFTYSGEKRKLTDIPTDIPDMVEKVVLASNEITDLRPGVFSRLSKCSYLNLDFNSITEIEPHTFRGLISLETLDLDYNDITTIHPEGFAYLPQLLHLYLDHNFLTQIYVYSFKPLVSLKDLHVKANYLTRIEPDSFASSPNLTTLGLSADNITSLSWDVLSLDRFFKEEDMRQVLRLHLEDNPIDCNEKQCWIQKFEKWGWITLGEEEFCSDTMICPVDRKGLRTIFC